MKTKRVLAMCLTIAMVLSLLGAFPVSASNEGSNSQIDGVDTPTHYAQDGTFATTADVGHIAEEAPEITTATSGNNNVQTSKTIVPTDEKNKFQVTLKVETTEDVAASAVEPEAALVLVIDNSSSMYMTMGDKNGNTAPTMENGKGQYKGYAVKANGKPYTKDEVNSAYAGEYENEFLKFVQYGRVPLSSAEGETLRIETAREEAIKLVNSFASSNISGEIAVVSFSENGVVKQTWTTDPQAAITAINSVNPETTTNTDAGLTRAMALLREQDIENQYVFLLAGGKSNYYLNDNTKKVVENFSNSKGVNEAKAAARRIKGTDALLYTVACGVNTLGLGEMATGDQYTYDADDVPDLAPDFERTTEDIEHLSETWCVTDPMGKNIQLCDGGNFTDKDGASDDVTMTGDGFVWDLKTAPCTAEDGVNVYTLTYDIVLDTESDDFLEGTYYLTNGHTSMEYFFKDEVTNNGKLINSPKVEKSIKTIDFSVPAVKGTYPDDYTCTVNYWLQDGFDGEGNGTYEGYPDGTPEYTYSQTVSKHDLVTAEPKSFEGYTLNSTRSDDEADIEITEKDQTLNIFYDKYTIPAGVTVTHHYEDNFTTVVDGKVKTTTTNTSHEDDMVTETKTGKLYGGMTYTATEVPNGFDPSTSNVTSMTLEPGMENKMDLYYTKSEDDLVDATVQVIHYYTTKTTNLVGTTTEESSNTATVKDPLITGKYEGETFTATPNLDGFTKTTADAAYTDVVLKAGENTIEIYYTKDSGNAEPATLVVSHVYTTEYAVGDPVVETKTDDTVNSWATVKHTYSVETKDNQFEVKKVDSANTSVDTEKATVVLQPGENKIEISYYLYVDNRQATSVVVEHHYTTHDSYRNSTVEDGSTADTVVAYMEDDTYTADLVETYGENTYVFQEGERVITLNADANKNKIQLYYVREIDTTPHTTHTKPSKPAPVDPEPACKLTVNYVDKEGNPIAVPQVTEDMAYTDEYQTTPIEIEGYVFVAVSEDSDPESGIMDGDREVTYICIPIEDVPLEDEPDISTPPVEAETPTAEPAAQTPASKPSEPGKLPNTGDNRCAVLYLAIAGCAALGLAVLVKPEKESKKAKRHNH